MAIVTTYSHAFMEGCLLGEHDLESDTLKIALMDNTFAFDPDTHLNWAACSANEVVAGASGYVMQTLASVAVSIDASGNKVDIAATSATWTATGAAIPTTGSAIIYNDTHATDVVVMCIDYGADYDTADGKLFQINLSSGLGEVSNA